MTSLAVNPIAIMGIFSEKGNLYLIEPYQLQLTCKDFSSHQMKTTTEFIQINYRVHNLVDYKSFRYV